MSFNELSKLLTYFTFGNINTRKRLFIGGNDSFENVFDKNNHINCVGNFSL